MKNKSTCSEGMPVPTRTSELRRVRVMRNDLTSYVRGKGYTMVPDYFGDFHGWGTELFEQEQGSTNYSVGLIEKSDGSIAMVHPSLIQFVRGV